MPTNALYEGVYVASGCKRNEIEIEIYNRMALCVYSSFRRTFLIKHNCVDSFWNTFCCIEVKENQGIFVYKPLGEFHQFTR